MQIMNYFYVYALLLSFNGNTRITVYVPTLHKLENIQ